MSDSTKYIINGVEATEGTPLSAEQLKSIQVDKANNPNKAYPAWVEAQYTARKEEITPLDKPIIAATGRVDSRSPLPKTNIFAPKAQREATQIPVLAPKVAAGVDFSKILPPDTKANVSSSIDDGYRNYSATMPTSSGVENQTREYYRRVAANDPGDSPVDAQTISASGTLPPPVNSSAERSSTEIVDSTKEYTGKTALIRGAAGVRLLGIPTEYGAYFGRYGSLPPGANGRLLDGNGNSYPVVANIDDAVRQGVRYVPY